MRNLWLRFLCFIGKHNPGRPRTRLLRYANRDVDIVIEHVTCSRCGTTLSAKPVGQMRRRRKRF